MLAAIVLAVAIVTPLAFMARSGWATGLVGETTVDPDTTNDWKGFTAPGGVTSTQNVGRIWTDKSVFDKDYALSGSDALNGKSISKGDSDFLVGLSALSSTSNTTKTTTVGTPVDIVLVVDESGSMEYDFDQRNTRREALQEAANNFIDSAAQANQGVPQSNQIRMSVVTFADSSSVACDWTYVSGDGTDDLHDAIDGLRQNGGTRSDLGLSTAQRQLNDSNRENVQKYVILFTDGDPSGSGITLSDFDCKTAADAVNTAAQIKSNGATVYTIGIFPGANPNTGNRSNNYLNAVSSNYPAATASGGNGLGGLGSWFNVTWGEGSRDNGYYKIAANSDELNQVFEDIFDKLPVSEGSGSPIVDNSQEGNTDPGDLNFTDQLGSYMQVSGDKMTLVFADGIYEGTINDDGTVTFPEEKTTANTVYGSAKISDIKVTINKGDLATGDTVNVTIPASLLPMRNYDVDTDDKKMTVTDAYPVRLFYGVSLKADAKAALSDPTSDAYQAIIASQATEGTIGFYSNNFVKEQADGETTASFEPNAGNKFYYYTQDATLYSDADCTQEATQGDYNYSDTLYWKDTYWAQTENSAQEVSTGVAVNRGTAEWSAIQSRGNYNNRTYYIPAGTKRSDRPATLTSQKSENKTGTAGNVLNPSWVGKNVSQALGNNGKLSFAKPGSLVIKKTVDWGNASDDTKTNHNSFSFDITVTTPTGEDDAPESLNGRYNYFVNGAQAPSGQVEFTDGKGTVTMNGGDTLVIEGLPAGASFTVTETVPSGFTVADNSTGEGANTTDGVVEGKIVAGKNVATEFTNTYHATDVSLNSKATLKVQKILKNRDWRDSDSFDFTIRGFYAPTGVSEAPKPKDTTITVEAADKNANYTASFGDITFNAPGEYRYTVRENGDPEQPIAGIDYSDAIYRVTVMVGDNGTGALAIDSVKIERMYNDEGKLVNTENEGEVVSGNTMAFANTYKADSATQGIQGKKSYTDTTGGNPFQGGKFTFKLEAQGGFKTNSGSAGDLTIDAAHTPMPADAKGNAITTSNVGTDFTFPSITFDGNDVGNTYVYKVTEEHGTEQGMSYSEAEHTVMIQVEEVNDDDGTHIKATVQGDYSDPNKLVFENEYKPTEAKLDGEDAIHGTKTLTGRDMKDGETYYFQLKAVDNNAKSVLPKAETVKVTKDNMKDGSADFMFDEMSFTKVGTYTFTVNEVADESGTETTDGSGMTFDANICTVTVDATDTKTGSLKAEVSYSNDKHSKTTDKALFTNVYEASMNYGAEGKGGINVTKTMKDRPMAAGEFSFSIAGTDSSSVTADEASQKLTGADTSFQNGAAKEDGTDTMAKLQNVSFDQDDAGKTFSYIVDETTESGAAQVSYDKSQYRVDIQVVDNGNGNMRTETTVTKIKNADGTDASKVVVDKANSDDTGYTAPTFGFTNDYNPKPATVGKDASHQIQVKKTVTGADSATDYTFTLTATGDNVDNITGLGEHNQLTVKTDGTIKAGESQTKTFSDLTFSEPGTYTFTVQENQPDKDDGWTFDDANKDGKTDTHTVEVVVTDLNDEGQYDGNLYIDNVIGSPVEITNSYEANPVVVGGDGANKQITVQKSVSGADSTADFNFKIEPVDPKDDKWNNVEAASDDFDALTSITGGVTQEKSKTASFGGIKFNATGEYEFKITEVEAHDGVKDPAGWTYDDHESFVTVKVTDKGNDGQLDAEVTYDNSKATTDADKAVNNAAAFTNSYKPEETTTTDDTSVDTNILVTKEVTGAPATEAFTFELKKAEDQDYSNVFEVTGDKKTPFDGVKVTTSNNIKAGATETKAFAGVTFTAAGDYKFVIDEITTTNKPGWTYDSSTHQITVHVEDKDAKLVITGIDDNDPTFTNSYKPNEVTTDGEHGLGKLQVTKKVTGAPATEEFKFNLELTSGNGDNVKLGSGEDETAFSKNGITATTKSLAGKEDATEVVSFDDISFTAEGVYTFSVTETTTTTADGWHYGAGSPAKITVTVTDKGYDGQLDATTKVEQDGNQVDTNNPTIVNSYSPGSVTVGEGEASGPIQVTKNITGTAPATEDFNFELAFDADADGNTGKAENIEGLTNGKLTTTVNKGDLEDNTETASFGNLIFKAEDDYYFTVTETTKAAADSGWTYDNTPKTVVVHVKDSDDHDGHLVATVDDDAAVITNSYTADEVTVGSEDGKGNLSVTKKVTGAPATEEFGFTLKLTSDNAEHVTKGLDKNGEAKAATTKLEGAGGSETVVFNPLTFDAEGTYTFEVTETTKTSAKGWTYDNTPKTITVTVTDEGHDGKLDATTKVEQDGKQVDTNNPTITNSYHADSVSTDDKDGVGNIQVTKQVKGNSTDQAFSFTATLEEGDRDSILTKADDPTNTFPKEGITKETAAGFADNETKTVDFGSLTFTATGDYTFKVVENGSAPANWTYATGENNAQLITIHVTDGGHDGQLDAAYDDEAKNNPTFTNTYKATGELPGDSETEADLTVTKVIDGRKFQKDDSFTFTMAPADDSTKAAVKNGTVTLPKNADGLTIAYAEGDDTATKTANFGNITFALPGTYTFTVAEQQPAEGTDTKGMTYSTEHYTMTVKVEDAEDGNGKLTAAITSIKDADGKDAAKGMVFTNTYRPGGEVTPSTTDAEVQLTKVLEGRAWGDDETFSFTITGDDKASQAHMPKETTVEVGQPAEGNSNTFSFGPFSFDAIGTYHYTVKENAGKAGGMTYSTNEAKVTIKVFDNLQGGYGSTVQIENPTFTNIYNTGEVNYDAQGGLRIVKNLEGHDIAAGQFAFTLTAQNKDAQEKLGTTSKEYQTAGALLDGTTATETVMANTNMTFTKADAGKTFSFTVAETKGGKAGYTNDTHTYKVDIAVTDNGQGALTVVTSVDGKKVATYTATAASAQKLEPVTLTFNNSYEAKTTTVGGDAEAQIVATKTLTGRPMTAGEFDFVVKDAKGATVATGSNAAAADGSAARINFSAITYTTEQLNQDVKDGIATIHRNDDGTVLYEYAYTVAEDAASLDEGVTGTETGFAVTVTVTDDGQGNLQATVEQPSGTLAFTNTYGTSAQAKASLNGNKVLSVSDPSLDGPSMEDIAGAFSFTLSGSAGAPMPEKTTATNDAAGNVDFGTVTYTMENVFGADGSAAADDAADEGATSTDEAAEGAESAEAAGTEVGGTNEATDAETVDEATDADKAAGTDEGAEAATNADAGVATESAQRSKTFTYTVKESGSYAGVTNDTATKTIAVTVTDNGDGTLSVEKHADKGAAAGMDFTFTNTYKVEPGEGTPTDPATGGVSITKKLAGRDLAKGEFAFQMSGVSAPDDLDASASVLTATNAADGSVSFGNVTFTKPGTYVYAISEIPGDQGGVTFDSSVYYATATVTDNQDGTMSVAWAITNAEGKAVDAITFNNAYEIVQPGSIVFGASKVLSGRALKAGEFSFELKDAEGNVLQTVKNGADGSVVFTDPVMYGELGGGTYEYTISEVLPEDDDPSTDGIQKDGVTYDETVFHATVTVTDNGDGTTTAQVSYDSADGQLPVFSNSYKQPEEPQQPQEPTEPPTSATTPEPGPSSIPQTSDFAPTMIGAAVIAGAVCLVAGVVLRMKRRG